MDREEIRMAPSPGRSGVLRISRFLNTKEKLKIGNWNVRTMNQIGKIQQVENEFMKYSLDILALSETRCKGSGKETLDQGNTYIYSGRTDGIGREGVGMMLTPRAVKALTEWKAINSRLLLARFKSRQCNLSFIVCYAPTNDSLEEVKDAFYEELQSVIDEIPERDMRVVIGDMNAKVGRDNQGIENVMGVEGLGEVANENGAHFISFCTANHLVIGGTLFQQKDIHKYTWTSPCGQVRNQIDHIAINQERKRTLRNVRSYRGADIGSDHQLLIATLKLKLKAPNRNIDRVPRYDTAKLLEDEHREAFAIECRNRFAVLETLRGEEQTINEDWSDFKNTYQSAGREVLGHQVTRRKPWISSETWDTIKMRQKQKLLVESFQGSNENYQVERAKYSSIDSEVKRKARNDWREYLDMKADEADKAMGSGSGYGVRIAHRIINEISTGAKKKRHIPIKKKDGSVITTEAEERQRWMEHFSEVMNRRYEGNNLIDIPEADEDLDVSMNEFNVFEVEAIIKKLRRWKAPGYDGITAEMILAENEVTPRILTRLFCRMWHEEVKPDEWELGVLVKMAKKGDLTDCNNYRGITLTSVVMKIYSMLILNRLERKIDEKLRDEQAGFRKGRSCTDQIFILRHVLQQCVEYRNPLLMAFVDYEKAFDSVHRPILWRVLRYYGIPLKYVNLIKNIHEHSRCKVNVSGVLSNEFSVNSGVLQGNVLSPMLFILLMDFVMRRTVRDGGEGVEWLGKRKLTDLEYADDAVLISKTPQDLQSLLSRMNEISQEVGLKINRRKTEMMRTEHAREDEITLEGERINDVESFKYLGTIISNSGSLESEFNERLKRANQTMARLSKIWKSNRLKLHIKIRLYISLVRSVLLYGHESWYDNDTISNRFRRFENKALRRILGVKWQDRIRNERIREITQVPYVDEIMLRGRWRWFGHALRTPQERLVHQTYNWAPQGTRRVGRPRPTWLRTMRREIDDDEWRTINVKAQDRNEWRNLTEALCVNRRWRR